MPPFPEGRWRRLSALLDRVLEAGPDEREALVAGLGPQDEELAAELRSLLAEHRSLAAEGFLEGTSPRPYPPATLAGQAVGPYTLRSEIGTGGMGSVWLADRADGLYTGQVAVKILSASHLGHQGEARFRREGTILARLRHCHIAQLLDAGVSASGQPYLVLEYVRGERIDHYCDSRRLGVHARIRLFLGVLDAVSHAHGQLIVHRDIKPSNVLVAADGAVKLLDFGIAKLLEGDGSGEDTALTREGEVVVTPEYAAPEQLTGEPVSTATDVYALGVLLYVLLTGQHPAGPATGSPVRLLRTIVEHDPARLSAAVSARDRDDQDLAARAARRGTVPRRLRAALQGDLENIVARALKKAPAQRYPSVAALADDLRRHLHDQPVSARPDSLAYRAAKFARRNRTAVALGALAAAALAAGLVGTVGQARRATRQAARADTEARRAVEQRDFALRELARSQAVNDLNVYLMSDGAAAGRRRTADEMLADAERVVERMQEPSDVKAQLLIQIGEQHEERDAVDSGVRVLRKAYALAQAAPDPSTRARAACALADVVRIKDDTAEAARLVDEGLRALPDGPQHGTHRIFCLIAASRLAFQLDHGDEALALAEEAHRLARSVAVPSALLDVDVSLELAACYRAHGRLREAAALLEEGFARLTGLGRGTTERAGTLLNNWALVVSDQGHPLDAVRLYRRAIAVGDGLQSPTLLFNLATELRDLGQVAEAAALAERAQAEAERLGERLDVSRVLLLRATLYQRMNRLDRATRVLDELEAALKEGAVPTKLSVAVLHIVRAEVALGRGDRRAAAEGMDRGVEEVPRSAQGGHSWPAVLLRRSRLELALGMPERAQSDAEEALRVWRSQAENGTRSCWIGRAALAQAQALDAEGRAAEARRAAAVARANLEPTLGEDHSESRLARQLAGGTATPAPPAIARLAQR